VFRGSLVWYLLVTDFLAELYFYRKKASGYLEAKF
jgi:hypothetical protein